MAIINGTELLFSLNFLLFPTSSPSNSFQISTFLFDLQPNLAISPLVDDHQTHPPTYLPTSQNWKFEIIKIIKKTNCWCCPIVRNCPFRVLTIFLKMGKKQKPGVEILDQGISNQHKRQWMD